MLNEKIKNKLFDYQINHTERLIKIIQTNGSVLDASDTGTGKTYCGVSLCAQLNLKPFVICPKAVISGWESVCKDFNVKPFVIVNYETIWRGKYYKNIKNKDKRVTCPYLDVIIDEKGRLSDVNWKVPDDVIFIFDEVHKCSHFGTFNSILLYTAFNTGNKLMALSATVADNPSKFLLFTYILNFIDPSDADENMSFKKYISIMENWIFRDRKPMVKIHHMLFPDRASRIRIDDLGDKFPETQITSDSYFLDENKRKQIIKEYEKVAKELDKLRDKKQKDKSAYFVTLLRAHQKIELLKIPIFVELAHDFKENGFSIVIFVNFTQTLKTLSILLKTDCLIHGSQTKEERDRNINLFMKNKKKIIICNIKAGGVGISLHDKYGGHPRMSLVSPTWNSIELVQALGRIHRAGGKSKSIQKIIYVAKTVEEDISRKVKKKLRNINSINNGDLDLTNITYNDKKFDDEY